LPECLQKIKKMQLQLAITTIDRQTDGDTPILHNIFCSSITTTTHMIQSLHHWPIKTVTQYTLMC